MPTDFRLIQEQCKTSEVLLAGYKLMAADLRHLVMGDYSAVDPEAPTQQDPGFGMKRREAANETTARGLYDAFTRDFDAGLSNHMLENLRTLATKAVFHSPMVECEGVDPMEEALIQLYTKARMGPKPRGCDATQHARMAVLMFLIDGVGFLWNTVQDGQPVMISIDTLDCYWDWHSTLLCDSRYRGFRIRRPLGTWIDLYGEEHFTDLLDASKPSDAELSERGQEMIYHWDTDGAGTQCVWRGDKAYDPDCEPVEHVKNPHYSNLDGFRRCFQPLDAMSFMQLPQGPYPFGVAALMAPHQVMSRILERSVQLTVMRGVPAYVVDEDTLADEQEEKKFLKALVGGLIKKKKNAPSPERLAALEVSQTLIGFLERQKQQLIAMSGANPYSGSTKVEGIKFSAEVSAIQSQAGLVEGSVSMEHTRQMERSAQMMVWNGILYDHAPLKLNMDGEILEFGPGRPIGQYLRGDADIVVAEDSTLYESRDQRVARRWNEFLMATKAAPFAPKSMQIAYERLLRAQGVRNTSAHFEQPAPADPLAGALGGGAGGDGQMGMEGEAAATGAA